MERKLRLEKAKKHLRLAVERQDRKARLEKISYHTAQISLGDRGRKKSKKLIGFNLDLIWIDIGVKKNSRNEPARPLMGTIFLVIIISSMNKSQILKVFHGRQKLTSAMKLRPEK